MEQTAVNWLVEELETELRCGSGLNKLDRKVLDALIDKAKAMEKQQIIEAVYSNVSSMSHDDLPAGESYYNKKFKP